MYVPMLCAVVSPTLRAKNCTLAMVLSPGTTRAATLIAFPDAKLARVGGDVRLNVGGTGQLITETTVDVATKPS